MKKYMFDTNAFNRLCDGELDIVSLKKNSKFYATHIQLDELANTKDEKRRKDLLESFQELTSENVATESAVWDISKWNEAKWSDEAIIPTESAVLNISRVGQCRLSDGSLYKKLLKILEQEKPKDGERNIRDALIAETCIKNKFILVTADNSLLKVANNFGCNTLNWDSFLKERDCIDT